MTPLIRACPGILEIENNNGETPQSYLDKGAKRSAELHEENRLKSEKMKQEEDEREAKLDGIDEKRLVTRPTSVQFWKTRLELNDFRFVNLEI